MMKICKDGRVWGQNNKEAGSHLGILTITKITHSKYNQGNKNPMFGTKRDLNGNKNPNWKGGLTSQQVKIRNEIQYKLWCQAVFARDNYTCQECGKQGGQLSAHHIKSFAKYPELRLAIDNGKTLCYRCHKLTESFNRG